MISPRNRLLFWFAVITVPFSVLAGVYPVSQGICVGVITGLLLLVAWDAFRSRRRLEGLSLETTPIARMALGREGVIELLVRNASRKARCLRVALPLPAEFSVIHEELSITLPDKTEWSKISWPCLPKKRGRFSANTLYVEVPSTLGFWDARKALPMATEIRVYPNMRRERKSLELMFRGGFGIHAQRQVGKGREFEKLRDYVPGDGSEDIHWKATARRGRPVTKVFQIEKTQEVYLALDASRLSAREDAIENHVSTALLVGMAAEQQGDHFGLISFADRVEKFLRAANGATHYHACRDAIHALQPRRVNPDFDEVCSFIRLQLRRRALIIFLTALDDPVLAENFIKNVDLIARHHLVMVGMMKPSGIAPLFSDSGVKADEDIYEHLGGHLRWHNLEEVAKVLQRRGVKLAMFDRGRMGLQTVSEYLNIKKRQLL